jgi:hypothetical protein
MLMSDSHKHSHDHSAYYLEQLCTMGACGALGLVVVLLYFQKTLDNQRVLSLLLANYLHPFLVGSGIAILAIVGLRGTFLIMSARRRSGKDSDIDHHESCSHQHDNNRWSPMRYVVLCLPVILFLLGLPNEGFRSAKAVEIEEPEKAIAEKHGDVIHLDFMEFYDSVHSEAKREYLQGRTGVLKGQLTSGSSPTVLTLVRFKRTCCPSDAIPLPVAVISPESALHVKNMAWVEVTGQIQYGKRKGRDQYIPILKPRSSKNIILTGSEDPYYLD